MVQMGDISRFDDYSIQKAESLFKNNITNFSFRYKVWLKISGRILTVNSNVKNKGGMTSDPSRRSSVAAVTVISSLFQLHFPAAHAQ